MPALNPYTAGNPIGNAAAFYGRDDVLKQVRQMLRNPRESAIVLFGQRRIGKTSVLLQLEREFELKGTATAVYFDLQDKAIKPLPDVLYELAQRIAVKAGMPCPSRTDFDGSGQFFRDVFLPAASAAIGEHALVLLFDEFDVLDAPMDRRAGQTFFPYLRAWMDASQRVRFVFVIGRRPEDLSIETVSAFKGVRAARVSLLEPDAAKAVVYQSETDHGMRWSEAAVDDVLALTRGHAYLTQLLCSVVWEAAFERDPLGSQPIDRALVAAAVDEALKQGANAFTWIWEGLPPAERVVIAAMAEAAGAVITHDELIEILNRSGVRLIVRELELAPETLVEWELLQPASDGYTFSVPLFRRWVSKHRPLRRVKDELDRLDPLAEGLFQTGQQFYRLGQNDVAQSQLRQALSINPNHLKSRLLLGRLLLETQRADESVTVLSEAYSYDRPAARADLIRALLASADGKDEDQQGAAYARVLEIDPGQPIAQERLQHLQALRRERELALAMKAGEQHEAAEHWAAAAEVYRQLLDEYPEYQQLQARYAQVRARSALAQRYAEAVAALDAGETLAAQQLFAQVIGEMPAYQDAARHLLRATTGVDVVALERGLKEAQEALAWTQKEVAQHEAIAVRLRAELADQQDFSESLRLELLQLQASGEQLRGELAAATAQLTHAAPAKRRVSAREITDGPRERIVRAIALAKSNESVVCPECSKKMTREKLIQHAPTHGVQGL